MPGPEGVKPRALASGQRSQLWVADVETGSSTLVLERDDVLFEAPNWTSDGGKLIVNGAGRMWAVPLTAAQLTPIEVEGVPDLNNDHALGPDGASMFISANDWHIYHALLAGGVARRITGGSEIDELMHFLHGVSPDGCRLAFVGLEPDGDRWDARANIFTVSVDGDDYRRLTDTDFPADGCEYSPDGRWIYFNTEQFSGHAQLARVLVDGGDPERLRVSETVDWFPHLSPDGQLASFLAFPPGTEGHPADRWVDIMTAAVGQWQDPKPFARIFGGQGSLNVNSWAPDSRRFAYVSYPMSANESF